MLSTTPDVALTLTIVVGVLQFAGLAVTLAELSAIRAHEWNRLTWWAQAAIWWREVSERATRAAAWMRRKITRLRGANVKAASADVRSWGSHSGTGSVGTGTLTDQSPPAHATDAERIKWLTRYVNRHDADLKNVWASLGQVQDRAVAAAREGDEALRQEQAESDRERQARRQAQLKWSLARQVVATVSVLVGVGLTTAGAIIVLHGQPRDSLLGKRDPRLGRRRGKVSRATVVAPKWRRCHLGATNVR